MTSNRYRVFILGAGFSRPAGFPLATDLWNEIYRIASKYDSNLRASKFIDDLNSYIKYRNDCDDISLTPEKVDFEDFMKFLDIEHFLGLRGGDTWSDDGNEGTVVTKTLIGAILSRHHAQLKSIPDLYLKFARNLEANDIVITFNYDVLLERSLDAVGKPYRFFGTRLNKDRTVASSNEVIIFKAHGSIDWFDRARFEEREEHHKKLNASPPTDVVFSDTSLGLTPVLNGYYHDTEPLKNMYRVSDLNKLYAKQILFSQTPKILSPSSMKMVYAPQITNLWHGIDSLGVINFDMAVIGYSLPQHDDYARQILYNLTTNYQSSYWGDDEALPGMRKNPMVLVDYFQTPEAEKNYRDRYRFVDWEKAILHSSGFDTSTLKTIFPKIK